MSSVIKVILILTPATTAWWCKCEVFDVRETWWIKKEATKIFGGKSKRGLTPGIEPSPQFGLWLSFLQHNQWTFLFSHVFPDGPKSIHNTSLLSFALSSQFTLLLFLQCTKFFSSPGCWGAIVCLRLVYGDHWFAQWGLARAQGREDEGGSKWWDGIGDRGGLLKKHEWSVITLTLSFFLFVFLQNPSLLHLGHLRLHLSTSTMGRQEDRVSLKLEVAAGAGQRLISVVGPAIIPMALRHLASISSFRLCWLLANPDS